MAHASIAAPRSPSTGNPAEPPPTRLVLASEALREDLAPIEPGETTCRLTVGGIAVALALLGVALNGARGTLGPASGLAYASATATAALALLPFSYTLRAIGIAALGLLMMGLGITTQGPLAGVGLGSSVPLELARLVTVTLLPGALLFRGRYRAYPRARWLLGAALIASIPFAVGRCIAGFSPDTLLADRATAALNVAVILAGLFGFMGSNTTAGGSVWAALVLGVLSLDIALRGLSRETGHWLALGSAAVGAACAATLTALGSYHLLAKWMASDARKAAPAPGSFDQPTGHP
jgi:hypothetical protein